MNNFLPLCQKCNTNIRVKNSVFCPSCNDEKQQRKKLEARSSAEIKTAGISGQRALADVKRRLIRKAKTEFRKYQK